MPYGAFCDLAKWVYVDIATRDFTIPRRKQTISRVAILTGLSRKEVKRLNELESPENIGAAERYNRAVRVISGWRKDPLFLDSDGNPKELSIEGREDSFSALVKVHSGDIPHRAVLDEMLNTGVVEVKAGKTRLLTRGYMVRKGEAEKLNILGTDVSELISTIKHNIECDPPEVFLQRKTSYDNIPEEAIHELRGLLSKMGTEFIEQADKVISRYDKDTSPAIKGVGQRKAGIGVFYFE
ncbi:MAG: hypothetical protein HY756_11630 [Nitrospirae bacterium]|nr:hypothetical protein [Nitrospirota bacterium]